MPRLLRDYGLAVVLFLQYAVSHAGHGYTLHHHLAQEAQQHGQELAMSDFWWAFASTTLENWQSESWQSFWLVLLPIWLLAKGSPQSRDGEERMEAHLERIEYRLDGMDEAARRIATSVGRLDRYERRDDTHAAQEAQG